MIFSSQEPIFWAKILKLYKISCNHINFQPKRSVEGPKQAKSIILLDFSRIFAIQVLSGLASPYTWPISTIPSYHPSL